MINYKTAIIIVVFNISNLILTQIELIRKFCNDDGFDIIVIDNSSVFYISDEIKKHTINANCIYDKTPRGPVDFSHSHAFACNYAYNKFQSEYEFLFFLDHDNFPTTNFSVKNILGDKIIGGIGQSRKTKIYFWPGCLMFNNTKIDKTLINFSTNNDLGLDTGGMLYKIIETYGQNNCLFFDEYLIKNELFDGTSYNNYAIISKQSFSFMHFINASNWNPIVKNENRISSLLKILHSRIESKQ